jgi:hypothetical protein
MIVSPRSTVGFSWRIDFEVIPPPPQSRDPGSSVAEENKILFGSPERRQSKIRYFFHFQSEPAIFSGPQFLEPEKKGEKKKARKKKEKKKKKYLIFLRRAKSILFYYSIISVY